jgi:hypothetical protein
MIYDFRDFIYSYYDFEGVYVRLNSFKNNGFIIHRWILLHLVLTWLHMIICIFPKFSIKLLMATQHTTACCSMQVIDITLVKYHFIILHPSEWYNRNISVFIQALDITSHNCTKDSSSPSVQRGTLEGSTLMLQTLTAMESNRLNMTTPLSSFIL